MTTSQGARVRTAASSLYEIQHTACCSQIHKNVLVTLDFLSLLSFCVKFKKTFEVSPYKIKIRTNSMFLILCDYGEHFGKTERRWVQYVNVWEHATACYTKTMNF